MDTQDLSTFYLESIGPQADALELALSALEGGDTSARDSIMRVAHQLKGSGASFGFDAVTDTAIVVLEADADTLPQAASTLVGLLRDMIHGSGQNTRRILIVDDDASMQGLLRAALEGPATSIETASSGEEALELLRKGHDLVVLDLFLPDIDGRDVLKKLRTSQYADTTGVIVVSGAGGELVRAESTALGADAFIEKPFRPDEFQAVVKAVLNAYRHRGPAVAITATAGAPRVSSNRVFVAEDDSLVASLIQDRLTRDGFVVETFPDGVAALAAARADPPAIFILDVKMPRMGGFETLANVRGDVDLAATPVIVLTAMGSEEDVVRGFELGATDYMLKPFSPVELSLRVQRLADSV